MPVKNIKVQGTGYLPSGQAGKAQARYKHQDARKSVVTVNPNTGRKMNLDANIYEVFSKAISHTLKQAKTGISYTELVKGVKKCFKETKTNFKGSIEWYAVTVKNDLVSTGVIETYFEKGTKLHRLKK